jgi:hypothetical protein
VKHRMANKRWRMWQGKLVEDKSTSVKPSRRENERKNSINIIMVLVRTNTNTKTTNRTQKAQHMYIE